MANPQVNYLTLSQEGEVYRLYYTSWGKPSSNKILVCVHGLTRNGRDFDAVGQYFSARGFWVIAPDMPGRGNSSYLVQAKNYNLGFYGETLKQLFTSLKLTKASFLGTSMGGLLGLKFASELAIKNLILNDIGPEVESEGLRKIASYTEGSENNFSDFVAAKAAFSRRVSAFGVLPEEVLDDLVLNYVQRNLEGDYEFKFDTRIMEVFFQGVNLFPETNAQSLQEQFQFWPDYQKLTSPVMVIRGSESKLFSSNTLQKMKQLKPELISVELPLCGHAPHLFSLQHMQLLANFLQVE